MNEFEKQLEQELMEQGASSEELRDLIEFRNKITKLSDIRRSDNLKRSFLQKLEKRETHRQFFASRRLFTPAFIFALLIFIFITGLVSAQYSLPGQPLYPVKILSENIIKTVNPSFKDEILKRRSEEIKTITEQKKTSRELNNTINKYENDLKENKTVDPTKIQESKKNLEDARNNSQNGDRKEIENVINQTEDRINQSHNGGNRNERGDVKGAQIKVNSSDNHGEDHGQSSSQNNGQNNGESHGNGK